jgi:hypothetical protein
MTVPVHTDDRGWTLYHADYRDTLAAVADAGGADLIAFSPPYCDARSYGMGVSWGMGDYAALGDAVWSALKPGGHALVNVSAPVRDWAGDGRGTERGLHAFRLAIDWHDRIGFRTPDHLAFGRLGQPGKWPMGFRSGWEPLWWFQRPGAEGYFSPESIKVAASSVGSVQNAFNGRNGSRDHRSNLGYTWVVGETRLPTSLLDYGALSFAGDSQTDSTHPARWPYRLASDLVRCFAAPGALVVDPFVGSGTTAAAALANGRRFIGGDLGVRQTDNVPWVTVTDQILRQRTAQTHLF